MTKVDSETLKQILLMKSEDICELIETVGCAALCNKNLNSNVKEKLRTASNLMYCARTLMEQCGCEFQISIAHPYWSEPVIYST